MIGEKLEEIYLNLDDDYGVYQVLIATNRGFHLIDRSGYRGAVASFQSSLFQGRCPLSIKGHSIVALRSDDDDTMILLENGALYCLGVSTIDSNGDTFVGFDLYGPDEIDDDLWESYYEMPLCHCDRSCTVSVSDVSFEEKREVIVDRKKAFTKRITRIAVGMIIAVALMQVAKKWEENQLRVRLETMVRVHNRDCPKQLSETICIDSASTDSVCTFTRHYTIRGLSDEREKNFERTMRDEVVNTVKESDELSILKEDNIIFQYRYANDNGTEFAVISVTPDDYITKKRKSSLLQRIFRR